MSFLKQIVLFLATGLYSGYFPKAPGTAGSVIGLALTLYLRPLPLPAYIITTVAFFFMACWIAGIAANFLGERDPQRIVIDEIAGTLVAFTLVPLDWYWIAGGFVIFRLFDIIKPFPIRILEKKVSGGLGIVLDDVLAGVYTLIVLQMFRLVLSLRGA